VGNTQTQQYTTYNCPDPFSVTTLKYLKAVRMFDSLFERAHANKRKKDVELKVRMQNGLTYVVQVNHPIVAFLCLRHNYTSRDAIDIMRERVALCKVDSDNSFKNY
jgi:hypothetical protein